MGDFYIKSHSIFLTFSEPIPLGCTLCSEEVFLYGVRGGMYKNIFADIIFMKRKFGTNIVYIRSL